VDKRIGTSFISVEDKKEVKDIKAILSFHLAIILCLQSIPLRDKSIPVIDLIVERI
jgi:hypothetical protein